MFASKYTGPNGGNVSGPKIAPGSGGTPKPVNTKRTVGVTFQPAVDSLLARDNVHPDSKPLGTMKAGARAHGLLDVRANLPLIVYRHDVDRAIRNPKTKTASTIGNNDKKKRAPQLGENYLQGFTAFNGLATCVSPGGRFFTDDEFNDMFFFPGWTSPETHYTMDEVTQKKANGNVMFQGLFASVNLSLHTMYPADRIVVRAPYADPGARQVWESSRKLVGGYNKNYPPELQLPRMEIFDMRKDFDHIRRKAIQAAVKGLMAPGSTTGLNFAAINGSSAEASRISRSEAAGLKIIRSDIAKFAAVFFAILTDDTSKALFDSVMAPGNAGPAQFISLLLGGQGNGGQPVSANPQLQRIVVQAMYGTRLAESAEGPMPARAPLPVNLANFLSFCDRDEAHAQAVIVEDVLSHVKGMVGGKSVPGSDLIVVA